MIGQRRFPFGGIPVYNPQSLSKEEAIAQFHVRQAAYEHLMALLREERPPHVLIIGTRGMGKTTLLQRVRYGVEDAPELNRRYLVLVFPEEQYNVNRLHRFLLNAVDSVADAMERLQDKRSLSQVEAFAESVGKLAPEVIEEKVPRFLNEFGRQIRRDFLLLVDNADRLFEMIEEREQWRLRELLSGRRDLTFFGATAQASEGIYGSDRAFFEFFQIQTLAPLTYSEVRDLLLRLSESVEERESEKGAAKRRVSEWLEADAARLRTLVQLTGGNPRTTVLLFHLVLDGLQGGAREYLEQLLDQVTPGYKGRVDDLSPQAQQVLDAVALHWDPATAMEVASESGLETGVVSTQLTRLVRQGILEKADPGDSKKALYQVAERFFNIWYLMRASRRVRAKLRWFVEFLRVFFDNTELEQIAWERIERYRPTWRSDPEEVETAFAYMIASGARRDRIEKYLREKCSDTEEVWRPYLDLMEPLVGQQFEPRRGITDASEEEIRAWIAAEPRNASHWSTLAHFLMGDPDRTAEAESAFRRATEVAPDFAEAWAGLGRVLTESTTRTDEAERFVRTAITLEPSHAVYWCDLGDVLTGLGDREVEAEAAYRRALELDPKLAPGWFGLGRLLVKRPERVTEAEANLRKAIELDPKRPVSWYGLGALLAKAPGREAEAEASFRKAIELDPEWVWPLQGLGRLLADTREGVGEAESNFRKAIELNPKWAWFWDDLGDLLAEAPERAPEAEAAYRKAIELDPKGPWFWHALGGFLAQPPERAAEAEAAYRKAIELGQKEPRFWNELGDLLAQAPERAAEAEAAYRKAIELDPKEPWFWSDIGGFLTRAPERAAEAEAAYRKAIELDPKEPWFWNDIGGFLTRAPERAAEAEAAYRKAIELDPKEPWFWNDIGGFLTRAPERAAEAEAAYRKAIEQEPENSVYWRSLGLLLANRVDDPEGAEAAFRTAIRLSPDYTTATLDLGILLCCGLGDPRGGSDYLERAHELDPENPITASIAVAAKRGLEQSAGYGFPTEAASRADFWNELLVRCRNYPPFAKLLLLICDLVQEAAPSNPFARLYRAVSFAQLGEFPRASVAFEDALLDDPIETLANGQPAIETILAAAVKHERGRDFIEIIDKRDWKDAWRPIYEVLRAVEAGSAEYLKRVAVEIRGPALDILRRVAPDLPDMPT